MPEIKLYYNIDRPVTQRRTLYSGEGLTLSAMLLDAQCQPVNFEGGAAQLIIDDGTKTCKFWAWPARVDGETIAIDFDPAWVGAQKQLLCWFSFVASGGGRVNRMPLILDIAYTPILDGTQLPPPTAAYATPAALAEETAARVAGDAELRAALDATVDSVQVETAARVAGDKSNADKIAAAEEQLNIAYQLASGASSDAATAQRTADAAQATANDCKASVDFVTGEVGGIYSQLNTAIGDATDAKTIAGQALDAAIAAQSKAEQVEGSIDEKIQDAESLFGGSLSKSEGNVNVTDRLVAYELQTTVVMCSNLFFGDYRVAVDDSDPDNLRLVVQGI